MNRQEVHAASNVPPAALPRERRGGALAALLLILAIAAVWWALAVWPTGSDDPQWIARTRAACFGASRGGWPDAGGWILLVGEPAGMIVALVFGWKRSLHRDIQWIIGSRFGRTALAVAAALGMAGATAVGVRLSTLWAASADSFESLGAVRRVDYGFPRAALVDQHGEPMTIASLRHRQALLTFAYGHCATVCPTSVNALVTARREAGRDDVPIFILTVDPWRDTPERLPSLARHWPLGPEDRVISGRVDDVERALDALGVGRRRDETNGDVDHSAVAMILEGDGRIVWRIDGGPQSMARLLLKL